MVMDDAGRVTALINAVPTVFVPTLSFAAFAAYISPTGDWGD
jgi:hypothetical protein